MTDSSKVRLRAACAVAIALMSLAGAAARAAEAIGPARDAAIGAAYGAPGPRRCVSTTQPAKGDIGPAEACAT